MTFPLNPTLSGFKSLCITHLYINFAQDGDRTTRGTGTQALRNVGTNVSPLITSICWRSASHLSMPQIVAIKITHQSPHDTAEEVGQGAAGSAKQRAGEERWVPPTRTINVEISNYQLNRATLCLRKTMNRFLVPCLFVSDMLVVSSK